METCVGCGVVISAGVWCLKKCFFGCTGLIRSWLTAQEPGSSRDTQYTGIEVEILVRLPVS